MLDDGARRPNLTTRLAAEPKREGTRATRRRSDLRTGSRTHAGEARTARRRPDMHPWRGPDKLPDGKTSAHGGETPRAEEAVRR